MRALPVETLCLRHRRIIGDIRSEPAVGAVVDYDDKTAGRPQRFQLGAGGTFAAIEKQDAAAERQAVEIAELKTEIKKLGDVLTALAVQENRLDMHEKWIDELRRGLGWRIARSE